MAIAITHLKNRKKIDTAYVLDIDLHYGDGTENTLGPKDHVVVHNLENHDREAYMKEIETAMASCTADIIGISAGFDNHLEDWGGLLRTEDYTQIGQMVKSAARRCGGGYFGILEGGYNHHVLGDNVLALIRGMR
jgi:acetoin utilization deacetylase AcuC-like enzyme